MLAAVFLVPSNRRRERKMSLTRGPWIVGGDWNGTPDELKILGVSRNLSTLLRAQVRLWGLCAEPACCSSIHSPTSTTPQYHNAQAGALHREYMHFHARTLAVSGTPPRCTFSDYCNAKLVVSTKFEVFTGQIIECSQHSSCLRVDFFGSEPSSKFHRN